MIQNQGLEEIWAARGRPLFDSLLDNSWAILGPSWAALGRPLSCPERQVGAPWPVLEAQRLQPAGQNPSKSWKKQYPNVFPVGIYC